MDINEKIKNEMEFSVNDDKTFFQQMVRCWDMCYEYNQLKPSDFENRFHLIKKLFGRTTDKFLVISPFNCQIGSNIEIGENACIGHYCYISDTAKITFGDNVWVGQHSGFYTSGHSLDPEKRKAGGGYAHPIRIGNNVFIGAGVTVASSEKKGVTIGDNTVIAAGSVVTKDIPANVLAAGNPCKVIHQLE